MSSPKLDRRIRYTKMVIKEGFLSLMEKKPIEKITVKEICEIAEINRGTFYAHYKDVYDLLAQIENELQETIEESLQGQIGIPNTSVLPVEVFEVIAANYNLCKTILGQYGDRDFINRLVYRYYDASLKAYKKQFPVYSETQLTWIYTFIVNGCVGIVQKWVEGGIKESPQEVTDFIIRFSEKGMAADL